MTKDELLVFCQEYEEILLADGFEDAFVGIVVKFNAHSACYDYEKCVEILMGRDGLSREEADEYMEFNVLGAWVGDHTPVFLVDRVDADRG